MFVLGTIWVRTQVMPRWLALITYALALMVMCRVGLTTWVTMIFTGWAFLISALVSIFETVAGTMIRQSGKV